MKISWQELDPNEAFSIKVAQNILLDFNFSYLVFIHLNNGFLADAILKLENQSCSIVDNAFCEIGISVHKSSRKLLKRIPDLKSLLK